MTTTVAGLPPRAAARTAGVLYLLIIAGGLFAELGVREQLIVPGDAAATAANILAREGLWRVGISVHLAYLVCALFVALILYELFRPVSRPLALLALAFNLVAIAVESVNLLNLLAPLRVLAIEGAAPGQAPVLAYAFARAFSGGFAVSLVFFGVFCLVAGYLIHRSSFLPRVLGWLMALAGICYLVNSFALFLAPALAAVLFPYILMPCLVAELSLALWLTVVGLDDRRWEETAML